MAAKIEEETAPSSEQNLTCPLCLDIFDEPTLLTSCQHTFCRKCLKKYDLSHQDRDHIVCPLCRKITKFSPNRVDDLVTNMMVNELVDDYHAKCGGVIAVLEKRPKCTACKRHQDAVSFCRACNNYLCEVCLTSHQNLSSMFEGHEIVSIEDIIEGNVSIDHHPSEKCSIHKQENKDMFCEGCKIHFCFKCVISHCDHKIKSHEDFEMELQAEVNDLAQRCAAKKLELEKNIQNMEAQRHQVHTAIQKLREDVSQAYSVKAKQLEENHRKLIGQIDALESSFDDDFDVLKSKDRQKIKSICSSITLVDNDRLGRLETDSLSAHILLCEELKDTLKEATDHTSGAAIMKKAQYKKFKPADDTRLDLGNIESDPELQVIRCVHLRGFMEGMTKYTDDRVAIGYHYAHGIHIVYSTGNQGQYMNIPSFRGCADLVFQPDRSVCVSTGSTIDIYSHNGSKKSSNIQVTYIGYSLKLNKSPSDEIIIANGEKKVYIYDPTGTTLKHAVPTKEITMQASATKTGLIITSSCNNKPSTVTVYDRNGNAGKPLQAPSGVYLYAAVDEQDRVYVASVDCKNGKVVIRLYGIDGLNLKERVEFSALHVTSGIGWSYLVSLSPHLLAFAYDRELYFIKVSL